MVTRKKNTTRKEKTVMVQKYSEKSTSPKKQKKGRNRSEKRTQTVVKKQNETNETPEKNNTTPAWRIQVRTACGQSTMASEPAGARLLWAILYLVLPVTFGHTNACRNPALVFSAAIHFATKHSAPCSAVLRRSHPSWAAVVH